MSIQITAQRGLELTDALKDHVNEKFKKLENHFSHITHTHFILSVENKFQNVAKATMHLAGGGDITAHCSSEDMYASIDMLIKKLDEQIIKHKEKLQK